VEHKYQIIKRYQDGYLIRTGYNATFRRGYTPDEFLREIKQAINGRPRLIKMLYSNTFVSWTRAQGPPEFIFSETFRTLSVFKKKEEYYSLFKI